MVQGGPCCEVIESKLGWKQAAWTDVSGVVNTPLWKKVCVYRVREVWKRLASSAPCPLFSFTNAGVTGASMRMLVL